MNKSLPVLLHQYFIRGANTGALAMSMAIVISLENVLPGYIEDEEQLNEIFRNVDSDLSEIWEESPTAYRCSRCNYRVYGCTLEIMEGDFKYCPHCGAKVDEETEDELDK